MNLCSQQEIKAWSLVTGHRLLVRKHTLLPLVPLLIRQIRLCLPPLHLPLKVTFFCILNSLNHMNSAFLLDFTFSGTGYQFMTSELYRAAFEKACLVRHEPLNDAGVRAVFDAHLLHVRHVESHVNLLQEQLSG